MNITDTQLKLALARMLPDEIYVISWHLYKHNHSGVESEAVVRDTELLHLCWLVEETLLNEERRQYIKTLSINHPLKYNPFECNDPWMAIYFIAHATWQQRTIALCKVKGIEVV